MSTDPMGADAFTRASVEAYVQASTQERVELEVAIAEVRARIERARGALRRLDLLAHADPGVPATRATATNTPGRPAEDAPLPASAAVPGGGDEPAS